jgi:hypothetical protein
MEARHVTGVLDDRDVYFYRTESEGLIQKEVNVFFIVIESRLLNFIAAKSIISMAPNPNPKHFYTA